MPIWTLIIHTMHTQHWFEHSNWLAVSHTTISMFGAYLELVGKFARPLYIGSLTVNFILACQEMLTMTQNTRVTLHSNLHTTTKCASRLQRVQPDRKNATSKK
jgi:hypothetical protein